MLPSEFESIKESIENFDFDAAYDVLSKIYHTLKNGEKNAI